MKTKLTLRTIYFLELLTVMLLLGGSAYLEIYKNIIPCPLCLLQRLTLVVLGIIFLVGLLFNPRRVGYILLNLLSILVSLTGAVLAGRQAWLQYLPPHPGASCETSLQYMLQVLPLREVLGNIFQGGTECARVNWQFLYLSLAEWSFVWFILFFLVGVWLLLRPSRA